MCNTNFPVLEADRFRIDERFSNITTFGIGGKIGYFLRAATVEDLVGGIKFAKENELPWIVIGEGSNLLAADEGYTGVIIQNAIQIFDRIHDELYFVGSGNNLWTTITQFIDLGLGGMEKMSGIPGGVGGAIYGNAGAYGQEIRGVIESVVYYDAKEEVFKSLSNQECRFGYRDSIFKHHKDWIITGCKFKLTREDTGLLRGARDGILPLRLEKYPVGLKCPGSFFKNILFDTLAPEVQANIPLDRIKGGKLASGFLMEECGFKGREQGDIKIADYHANLFINRGHASFEDVRTLAQEVKQAVYDKFHIALEPEVQVIGSDLLI